MLLNIVSGWNGVIRDMGDPVRAGFPFFAIRDRLSKGEWFCSASVRDLSARIQIRICDGGGQTKAKVRTGLSELSTFSRARKW